MVKQIVVNAIIQADLKTVWKKYTNPADIMQWNFADPTWHCPVATNDMKVGGIYMARMEAKDGSFGFNFEAKYTHIEPEKQFTYEFGGRNCTVHFESKDRDMEVTISFDPEDENPIELQQNGWQMILNNFKSYVESSKKNTD